jgi:fructose-1,6-bisphosphatase
MKPSISAQMYTLLLQNTKGENAFMTYDDMGYAIFGQGYSVKKFRSGYVKMMKTQMFQVSEIAIRAGHCIVPSRKLTKSKNRTFIVTGWKIPMANDSEYVLNELLYKKQNGDAKTASFNRLLDNAKIQGIIASERIKELESHN